MKWFKRILYGFLITVFVLLLFGWGYLSFNTYKADNEMDTFLQSAQMDGQTIIFEHENATANIVFYPGGLVERNAYAKFAYLLANEGFNVYLVGMPLNLAILGISKANEIIETFDNGLPWYIGGHSLGGASASIYVHEHHELISGIFFLGSYPSNNSDLSEFNIKVLSITASNDLVLNLANYESTMKLLPDDTTYVVIEGGNHAQFGHYGAQKNDGIATITTTEQQAQTIVAIKSWILN
jgi:hypothetical protein